MYKKGLQLGLTFNTPVGVVTMQQLVTCKDKARFTVGTA